MAHPNLLAVSKLNSASVSLYCISILKFECFHKAGLYDGTVAIYNVRSRNNEPILDSLWVKFAAVPQVYVAAVIT